VPALDVISASRVIPAPAADIFELLARPARHAIIDGSGSVRGVQDGTPERLGPGAKFGMTMRIGLPYKIVNQVVEFDEPRLISWRHFAGHVWRYRLEPVDEHTTRVTEEFDSTRSRWPWAITVLGWRRRNLRSIQETLVRLEDWAEAGQPLP
jgi:hypothetical protein